MDPRENLLRIYRELADWYEQQRQPQMRDRFLVLAADAALTAGRPDEAERLRLRLLKVNPHHMLKPYGSYAQALKTPDVLTYVKDLRVNYPANVAEDLLRTLQVEAKPTAAAAPAAEKEPFVDENLPEPQLARTAPRPAAPRPTRICRRRSRCKGRSPSHRAPNPSGRAAPSRPRWRPPRRPSPKGRPSNRRPQAPGSRPCCSCWFWPAARRWPPSRSCAPDLPPGWLP